MNFHKFFSIVCSVILVCVTLVAVYLSPTLHQLIAGPDLSPHEGKFEESVLWARYQPLLAPMHLDDLNPKIAFRSRHYDLFQGRLFNEPPQSLDILIVGDSSLTWNISQDMLRRLTLKNISIVGYEGAVPTPQFARALKAIAAHWLRPDGKLFLMFSTNFWSVDPNSAQRWEGLKKLAAFDEEKLKIYLHEKERDTNLKLFAPADVERFANRLHEKFLKRLPFLRGVGLPDLPIYSSLIEPRYAPELFKKKNVNLSNPEEEEPTFYRWGPESVFQYRTKPTFAAQQHDSHDYSSGSDSFLQTNSKAWLQTWPKLGVVVVLQTLTEKSQIIRAMHKKNLPAEVELLDMPAKLPAGTRLPFRDGSHLANEGILVANLVLAMCINGESVNEDLNRILKSLNH